MTWWDWVKVSVGLKAFPSASPTTPELFAQLSRYSSETGGIPQPRRYYELVRKYGQSVWTYAAVHRRACDEAAVPLVVMEEQADGTLKPTTPGHPLTALLRGVNAFMTAADIRELNSINMNLAGNDYWLIFPNLKGEPAEIWPLRPDWVTPVAGRERFIDGYIVRIEGGPPQRVWPFSLSPDKTGIIHFKQPNPWNYFYGQGPLEPAWNSSEVEEASVRYRYAFYKNSARPDGLLSTDQKLKPGQVEQVREWWNESFKGESNAHRVGIVDSNFKYQAIAVSPKDSDIAKDRELSREDLLVAYGVSLAVLGIETGDTGRREEQLHHYYDSTIKPAVLRLASTLNEFLCPAFGPTTRVVPDFSGIWALQDDHMAQALVDQIYLNTGAVTINEVRERRGQAPVPWGDEPFDVPQVFGPPMDPLTGQPIGLSLAPGSRRVRSLAAYRQGALPSYLNGSKGRHSTRAATLPAVRRWAESVAPMGRPETEAERAAVWDDVVQKTVSSERGMRKALRQALDTLGERLVSETAAGRSIDAALDEALSAFQWEAQAIAREWLPEGMADGWRSASRLVRALLAGQRAVRVGGNGHTKTAAEAVTMPAFDLAIRDLEQYLTQRPVEYADLATATLSEYFRPKIAALANTGQSTAQIAAAVSEEFGTISLARATLITRTELGAAANLSRKVFYEESGVVESQEWLTARDERVRESHQRAEGQIAKLGTTFEVGGAKLRYPGDPSGPPGETLNCRCVCMPVLTEP